jgi:enterochelin esterase-like enzyme
MKKRLCALLAGTLGSYATYRPNIDGRDLVRSVRESRGKVVVLRDFASEHVPLPRNLYVYLPREYPQADRNCPVIYFNDGGNLFAQESSDVWNLGLDRILDALIDQGAIPPVVVVGIGSTSDRSAEYEPYPIRLPGKMKNLNPITNEYIEFMQCELIPCIESNFMIMREKKGRTIAGFSYGGVFAFYASLKKPELFGGILALSPSLWVGNDYLVGKEKMLKEYEGSTGGIRQRIYFDMGGKEGAFGDPRYVSGRFRKILAEKMKPEDLNMVYDPTGRHDGSSWTKRLPDALVWLLNGTQREEKA